MEHCLQCVTSTKLIVLENHTTSGKDTQSLDLLFQTPFKKAETVHKHRQEFLLNDEIYQSQRIWLGSIWYLNVGNKKCSNTINYEYRKINRHIFVSSKIPVGRKPWNTNLAAGKQFTKAAGNYLPKKKAVGNHNQSPITPDSPIKRNLPVQDLLINELWIMREFKNFTGLIQLHFASSRAGECKLLTLKLFFGIHGLAVSQNSLKM